MGQLSYFLRIGSEQIGPYWQVLTPDHTGRNPR